MPNGRLRMSFSRQKQLYVDNTNLCWLLVSAAGMMLVGVAAIVFWWRLTRLSFRWFWVGAALWAIAVAIKFTILK